jgi:hypothetical protein
VRCETFGRGFEFLRLHTETIGHELIGHAFHDAIDNVLEGWIWTMIGDKLKGGHDVNNTSGKAADKAEEATGKGYKKAKKEVKSKGEWKK